MKKRLLAWILVTLILIQCLPMNIFAVEDVIYLEDQSYAYVNPEYTDIAGEDSFLSSNDYHVPEFAVDYSEYLSDAEDLAAVLKEGMLNRESSIILLYTTPYDGSGSFTVPWDDIWNTALAHTGDPKEGDYIGKQWVKYNASTNSASVINGDVYCYIIWNVTYFTTAEQELEVDAEIERVLGEIITVGMDDYQKVKAIYDYICANVTYDYVNLNDSSYKLKHSAYAALIHKTAVCQGYALLFYRMALEVGIDARYISGIGNGGSHGWNIVELDGLYYNLDSTWDAGDYIYNYFLRCNANFGDHIRNSEYNDTAFNTKYPMDTNDYVYVENPYKCGDGVVWAFDAETGNLTISYTGVGTGKMEDYYFDNTPWYDLRTNIKAIVIEDGVTSIGEYAFYDCSSLTNVEISDDVDSIGKDAFLNCLNLENVNIPDGVTEIKNATFSGCLSLLSIDIPDGVTSISNYAFENCSSLTSIDIPKNVNSIGNYVFDGCSNLISINVDENNNNYSDVDGVLLNKEQSVLLVCPGGKEGVFIVPNTVISINSSAFFECNNLTSVDLSQCDLLVSISNYAFLECSNLNTVILPEAALLNSIGDYAFMNCTSLMNMNIPASVTSIGYSAFAGCLNLTSVYFLGDAPSIALWAFDGITVTAYYPFDNATWTTDVMQNYGGNITWVAHGDTRTECEKNGHTYDSVVTPPTHTTQGYTTHTCTVCGDSFIDSYTDILESIYGDINSDDVVNVDDVLICLDLAFVTPSEEQLELADLDEDGDIDVDDVLICLDLCFA